MYKENNFEYKDESKNILVKCLDKTIESFTVEKETILIEKDAFKDCFLLKNINLDSKSLFIEENAFPENGIEIVTLGNTNLSHNSINNENLKIINYTKNSVSINATFFFSSSKFGTLKEINISNDSLYTKENIREFSKDGIWYQQDNNDIYLVYYPPGKEEKTYQVEDFVTKIDQNAFFHNSFLETVILPKNYINEEEYRIFNNCENLKEIVCLSNKNQNVNPYRCPKVKAVYMGDKFFENEYFNIYPLKDYIYKNCTSFKQINKMVNNILER